MKRLVPFVLGSLIAALMIAGPLVYARHRHRALRNFHVVRDGVLYRSGQMTVAGLKQALHDYGIKTVVTCRDAREPDAAPPDRDEENYCKDHCISYHRMPPVAWQTADGSPPPVDANVHLFRSIMSDPNNYPVLVHCFAGIHRTGAYCAIYRMEREHWSNEQAIAEMVSLGYSNLGDHEDLSGYLERYQASWRHGPTPDTVGTDCCTHEHD